MQRPDRIRTLGIKLKKKHCNQRYAYIQYI